MTKVIKCASCNIVIDEMLAYIQNKVSVIDEDTLVRICISSFSKEEIEKSKLLLFESVPGNLIKRKNKGKEERDLADIVQVFKSKEPDLFPIYVARELERLPPVLFDHLDCTKLLKDLLKLQEEMKNIKSTYVSQSQFEQLRSELLQMKNDSLLPNPENVNKRRGAWVLDSGPEMNLAASSANVLNVNSNQNNYGDNNHNDWHVVQKRKKPSRYRYTGSAGLCRDSEGKFKAADRNIPIFITRIHNDTTDKDIIDYVYNKTKEMITLERISFKYEREYKAYKFFISESKSTLFLDSGLWPQGIIFRRFVNFKRKITNVEATPSVKRSVDHIRQLCHTSDIIALQETWLLPSDLHFLSDIDPDYGYVGTSAVDTSTGMLVGRPYGGVAILWKKSVLQNVSIVQCDNARVCAIKSGVRAKVIFSV
uniref:SFRICE_027239 n=1 Tax=Spodoptera frugiperda TaxID=7108 RepID=A0A2H1VBQ0_SPOFR